MSECVVRMEMPKSCRECPFMTGCSYCEGYSDSCVLAPDGVECGWDFFHEEGPTKRPDWCPIICSLPEGHGRLVDADDFIKHLSTEWENGEISNSEWCDIRQWMNEETTIVPAEAKRKVDAHDAVAPTDTPTDTPTVAAERAET